MRFARSALAGIFLMTIFSLIPSMGFGAFMDTAASPYREAIEALQKRGVVAGYDNGTFRPASGINRAEFLKIVVGSLGVLLEPVSAPCFPDLEENAWYLEYICYAKQEGIVSGYPDGTFKPEREINFVEAAKIIALAYDQEVHTGSSSDWYEPYVRALDSSKAIPTSVAGLSANVVRGEMAEMMWRLTDAVTDRPSKGYMNVKYPDVTVNYASDTPQKASSCTDLRAFREEASRTTNGGYGGIVGDMMRSAEAPAANMMKSEATSGDYSQTNVQVAGVDEADIVKTDGAYLYAALQNVVRIIHVTPPTLQPSNSPSAEAQSAKGDQTLLALASTIDLSAEGFTPQDLFIEGDQLVVLGSRSRIATIPSPVQPTEKMMAPSMIWPPYWQTNLAEVRIFDVTNRSAPKELRRVSFEGNTVTSRRIGDQLYLIVNQQTPWYPGPLYRAQNGTGAAQEEQLLPLFGDSAEGSRDEKGLRTIVDCEDVVILPRVPSPQFLTVAVIPLKSTQAPVERTVILGNAENVYMSEENLFIASTEWRYRWMPMMAENAGDSAPVSDTDWSNERTHVYRFAVTDDGVSMAAQGEVPGRILNQFSMDEHEGTFRIATTESSVWTQGNEQPSSNNLFILNTDTMVQAGSIRDIAPGEQIYSTRFLGDRAYMVTFRNVDPLFVMDTSNPRAPVILGKLKIPGYSDYLHPYDEHHLIGFGKEAVEAKEGTFAWYQGMKIALFDVTDVANPKELHKITIGDRGTDSPLLRNHKALLFDRTRNLLAFPATIYAIPAAQKNDANPMAYGSPVFQGALVYDLTLKNGFRELGKITHYADDAYLKAGDTWYPTGRDVERILRIGDSLLTVSSAAVQSHNFPSIAKEGELELPSSIGTGPGPWWEDQVR